MGFYFPLLGLSVEPVFDQAEHLKSQSIFHLSPATVIVTADVKKNLHQGNQKHMQNKFGETFQDCQRGNIFNEIPQECRKPVVQDFQPTDEKSSSCKSLKFSATFSPADLVADRRYDYIMNASLLVD